MSRLPALFAFLAVGCGNDNPVTADAPPTDNCTFRTAADDVEPPPLQTPRWAFRPWISKDISDGADTEAFVNGFRDRDIPVGVVVIDSPWETHYNTFVVNENRYPRFPEMLADLHAKDIKLVLWVTQMVNRTGFDVEIGGDTYDGPSPNFDEGKRCGFFVDDGSEYLWWKGLGAGVDFFDPEAVGWWHRQQDALLDLGIDGWKLDFGESYMDNTVATDKGVVPLQEYSEAYYRDFYAYGVSKRGNQFITMVRPWDESYAFPGRFFAKKEHAPIGWVGDQRRDWVGLADGLDHQFRSAAAGYVVVGADLGGYLDRDDKDLSVSIPFDSLTFARWTAQAAMSPWMQLHGRANLAPWTVPDHVDETIALYRYWATLHDELVPFWYTLARTAQDALNAGMTATVPMMRPLGDLPSWAGDYRYLLGDVVLVAPILDATGIRDVALPAGRWYDWWQPAGDAIDGNTTLDAYAMPERERIPLFIKEGAIIPANVKTGVTGLGTTARANALTVLAWPAATASTFSLLDEDDGRTTIQAATTFVELSRAIRPTYVRVRRDSAPASVTIGGTTSAAVADDAALDAAASGWRYDAANNWLWIKLPASAATSRADIANG